MSTPSVDKSHQVNAAKSLEKGASKKTKRAVIAEKVYHFIRAFFYGLFAAGFMLLQAPFFWTGFLIGVVLKDNMSMMIKRIIELWQRKPLLTTVTIIAATMFAFPIVLCATSFFFGGDLAARFVNYSHQKKPVVAAS